ncbi:MAG: thiamine-phosphate kinase, partial [Longimicrobiales bacterium]
MGSPNRRRIALGPGGEFDLIRRFLDSDAALPPEVRVGPGDDAAVLEGGWVVTTDLSVEDVHFRRAWLTDHEIGYRAAASALSDLAAMAATPVGLLVSLAAPRGGAVDVEAVHAGVRELAASLGAQVIGGDMSRSPGPLVLDVVALGRAAWPVLRDGAEPEDDVWVTGTLGASAAALRVWESGGAPSPELREAFVRPRPRIEEARCLVEHELVDALIDISDGLAGDAGHIAAASGVRITLDAGAIPVSPAAVAALGADAAFDAALHGGEDYELCFVTDPGAVDPEYFARQHGIRLTRVGRVSAGEGVWLRTSDGS